MRQIVKEGQLFSRRVYASKDAARAELPAEIPLRILFSAHGLPESIVKAGDPYQWQVERTAAKLKPLLPAEWEVEGAERVSTRFLERYAAGPQRLREDLVVKPTRESGVITLSISAEDAAGAARVTRAVMQAYLDTVLERRTGIPITLSVVTLEVARRSGGGRLVGQEGPVRTAPVVRPALDGSLAGGGAEDTRPPRQQPR